MTDKGIPRFDAARLSEKTKNKGEKAMTKNFGAKPYLFPQPVMMIGTYDENGNANLMNAAWGGIVGNNEIILDLSSHKTTDNIALTGAFTVAPATKETTAACDYVGIVSAKNEPEKMKKAGFTTRKSAFVNAPVVNELPLTMECKLLRVIDGSKYLGEIVNVVADDSILDADGEVDLCKYHPILFDTARYGYSAFGEQVGTAFSDGKKLK